MAATDLSFRARVLLAIVGVVLFLGLAVVVGMELLVRREIESRLSGDLSSTSQAVANQLKREHERMVGEARVISEEPRIKAVLNTPEVDPDTLGDVAQETRDTIGFAMMGLSSADGKNTALSGLPEPWPMPKMVAEALSRGEQAEYFEADGRVFQAVAVPVAFGSQTIGAVLVGNVLDDGFAQRTAAQMHAQVAFFYDGKRVATSLSSAQAAVLPPSPATRAVHLSGEPFLVDRVELGEKVYALVLVSEAAAFAPYARLERAVFGVSLAALVAGVGLALLISRGVSRPVAALIAFAREIGHGNLEARVEPRGGRELNALGKTLNQMAEELAAQKRKDELASFLVHDLKNPLTNIYTGAQLLVDMPDDPKLTREVASEIESAGTTMLSMVMDMLDVGRNADGKLQPKKSRFTVGELFETVQKSAAARASQKGQKIVVAGAKEKQIEADRELLRRVIENLLDNCFKYTPRGGTVTLEWRAAAPGFVDLRVADEGPGVPKDAREKIFDRYFRLDRDASAHARTSRGLGLVFCKAAAEAHGGAIWVEDNLPVGSAFCVRLPDVSASAASEAPPASSGARPA